MTIAVKIHYSNDLQHYCDALAHALNARFVHNIEVFGAPLKKAAQPVFEVVIVQTSKVIYSKFDHPEGYCESSAERNEIFQKIDLALYKQRVR